MGTLRSRHHLLQSQAPSDGDIKAFGISHIGRQTRRAEVEEMAQAEDGRSVNIDTFSTEYSGVESAYTLMQGSTYEAVFIVQDYGHPGWVQAVVEQAPALLTKPLTVTRWTAFNGAQVDGLEAQAKWLQR